MNQLPPHNLDAEGSVISAVFVQPELVHEVRPLLSPEEFYSEANRIIYASMLRLADENRKIDTVTVLTELRAAGQDRLIPGPGGAAAYLARIVDTVPFHSHVAEYAEIVAECARLRELRRACKATLAEIGSGPESSTLVDSLESKLLTIVQHSETDTPTTAHQLAGEVMAAATADHSRLIGFSTGIKALDRHTQGLQAPYVYTIAGRPGMGKSILAGQLARTVAGQGAAAVVISAEMPGRDIMRRLIAAESGVSSTRIKAGRSQLDASQWGLVTDAMESLGRLPLSIAYRPGVTVSQVRSAVRVEHAKLRKAHGQDLPLGLVVVDYLQLMTASNPKASREAQVSELSRGLMRLAGDLNCPMLMLSQLNRGLESRDDKRPRLSDLRESGSIEQDSHTVIMCYREGYYKSHGSGGTEDAQLLIRKDREHGPGQIDVLFDGELATFADVFDNDYDDLDTYGDFQDGI